MKDGELFGRKEEWKNNGGARVLGFQAEQWRKSKLIRCNILIMFL